MAGAVVPALGHARHAVGQIQIVVGLDVDHEGVDAAAVDLQPWWLFLQFEHAAQHCGRSRGIGNQAGLERLALLVAHGDALLVNIHFGDQGFGLEHRAVMDGRIGQEHVDVLPEQVRFVAFPERWNHQLIGFRRNLVLMVAMIDKSEITLLPAAVRDVFMNGLPGAELLFELGNPPALADDLQHAEGMPYRRFSQGVARVAGRIDDQHLRTLICQKRSQQCALNSGAQNGYIKLPVFHCSTSGDPANYRVKINPLKPGFREISFPCNHPRGLAADSIS